MLRKLKQFALMLTLIGITFVLSACGSKFADGDPYYYTLQQITGNHDENNVQVYVIDPFEGKVIDGADTIEFDDHPDLEEYEDTDDRLFFKYDDGKTEELEKKSDSLWVSTVSGVEYDVKKTEGQLDYTPVKYENE